MRRPRQKLQVSTFPFLAVLLCAMGSLILLLLVMDRRAKVVAKHKALEAWKAQEARKIDQAGLVAKELARAEAERRAEWEKQRDNLHQALLLQEQKLRQHLSGLTSEIQGATKHLEKHHANYLALQKQITEENQRLLQEHQDLIQRKAGFSVRDKQEAAARTELERLTLELLQMEKALRDLKDLKSRPSDAFSLVPYKGRQGDNRRPLYIECNFGGLVIHPGATSLDNATLTPMLLREEVVRRAGALVREGQRDADARTPQRNQNAYILFLVRPDGIENYYKAQNALKGYAIDFGYELVEAYWAFDFSSEDIAATQPWRQQPSSPQTTFSGSLTKSGTPTPRGTSLFGPPPTQGNQGTPGGSGGVAGPPGHPGQPGQTSSLPSMKVPGIGLGSSGFPSGPPGLPHMGEGQGIPSMPGMLASRPGSRSPVFQTIPGATAPEPGSFEGSGAEGQGNGRPSVLASVLPPSGLNLGGPNQGSRPIQGTMLPSSSNSTEEGREPPSTFSPGNKNPGPEGFSPQITLGTPGQPGNEGTAQRGPEGSPSSQPGEPGAQADKTAPKNAEPGSRSPGSSLWIGGNSGSAEGKTTAPTLGRLLSNHDYVITVECVAEGVVLYPRNELYPMTPVANQRDVEQTLMQAIQQLIARRQASVRAGETPYRPMIRLQVLPEGRRAYYWIYPVLESLRIPMIRENVEE